MKSYTDIEQSKKLAEILPLESVDMIYLNGKVSHNPIIDILEDFTIRENIDIPCWSLAALLEVIRKTIGYTAYGANNVHISCELGDKPWEMKTKEYDNEIDACYEMILKLQKNNLL